MDINYEELKAWQDDARRMLKNDIEQLKEELEQKRDRFKLAVGATNLFAVIGGTVAILLLLTLLFNMVYFVINDMGRSFSLFQTNF